MIRLGWVIYLLVFRYMPAGLGTGVGWWVQVCAYMGKGGQR